MQILSIFCRNPLKNLKYLLVDPQSSTAISIDPLDADVLSQKLDQRGLRLTHIINTHGHWDHVEGNDELKKRTDAEVFSVRGVKGADHILQGERFFKSEKLL